MRKNLTPAVVVSVVAELGRAEYTVCPTGPTKVEVVLQHDGVNPLVVLEADVTTGDIVVRYGNVTKTVESVFNNGAGTHFSTGDGADTEFMWNDLSNGVVRLNGMAFQTPAGRRREALADMIHVEPDHVDFDPADLLIG